MQVQTLLARETGKVRLLPGDMRVLLDPAHKKNPSPSKFIVVEIVGDLGNDGGGEKQGSLLGNTFGSLHVFSAFFLVAGYTP